MPTLDDLEDPNKNTGAISSAINSASISPVVRDINPDTETVQGQLSSILKSDNPILASARGGALRTATSRGLRNSTLAAQAGEQAVINTALPIASQDAATYNQQGQVNQGYQNQFALTDKNLAGSKELQASSIEGQSRLQSENIEGQSRLQAESIAGSKQLEQMRIDATNALSSQQFDQQLQINAQQQGFSKELMEAQAQLNSQARAEDFQNNLFIQQKAAEIQKMLSEQTFTQQQAMSVLGFEHQKTLTEIQNKFTTLTQNNALAAGVLQQTLAGIAAIATTPGLSTTEVNRAINIITGEADAALTVMDTDLSSIWGNVAGSAGSIPSSSGVSGVNTSATSDQAKLDELMKKYKAEAAKPPRSRNNYTLASLGSQISALGGKV